jgi:hypothetical protein
LGADRPSPAAVAGATLTGLGSISGPAFHLARRHRSQALGSLGARLLVPPTTAVLAILPTCLLRSDVGAECARLGLTTGFLAGAVGVSLWDAFVLARNAPLQESEAWYGWQTLALDAAGFGLGLSLAQRATLTPDTSRIPEAPLALALGMYAVGLAAPVVHLFHGRWLTALADLGLRWLMPPMWILLGLAHSCASSGVASCAETGLSYGFLAGSLTMAMVDAAFLSWKPLPAGAARSEEDSLTVVPSFQAGPRGATFGLGGLF